MSGPAWGRRSAWKFQVRSRSPRQPQLRDPPQSVVVEEALAASNRRVVAADLGREDLGIDRLLAGHLVHLARESGSEPRSTKSGEPSRK